MIKKYNSLIREEDHIVDIPRTDCMGSDCRNNSHLCNTNRKNRHHEHNTNSFAQVNFTGEALKPLDHRSKNPRTWEF